MWHDGPCTSEVFATIPKDQRMRLVLAAVTEERYFQDRKHGTVEEAPHTPAGWMLLIEAELAEAKAAVIKGGMGRDGWRQELLQVAALCVAAVEQHGIDAPNLIGREI